jgi:hypothetical protein
MSGLVDMHVHLNREDLTTYLAFGITTVWNMWGFPNVWAMMREIEAGETVGPTIFTVSSGLDGTPPKWPLTQLVMDATAADGVVEAQWQAGYRTLKVYQDLRPQAYDSIVAAARRRGMDFVGHVPHRVGLKHALRSGQRSLEHLSGFGEELSRTGGRGPAAWVRIRTEEIPALAAATRAAGAWVCPTLAIFARMGRGMSAADRDALLENRRKVVRASLRRCRPPARLGCRNRGGRPGRLAPRRDRGVRGGGHPAHRGAPAGDRGCRRVSRSGGRARRGGGGRARGSAASGGGSGPSPRDAPEPGRGDGAGALVPGA